MHGTEDLLRELTRDEREWLQVGTVLERVAHPSWGVALRVRVQPRGAVVVARPLYTGGDILTPYEVDSEVLLLCPGGDINRAIALGQPASSPVKEPSDYDHTIVLVRREATVRTSDAAPVEPVVTGEIVSPLSSLATAVGKLGTAVNSLVPGTLTPQELADIAAFVVSAEAGAYKSPALNAEKRVLA